MPARRGPAPERQPDVARPAGAVLMFAVVAAFLCAELAMPALELASSLLPIVNQPNVMEIGKDVGFGPPVVLASKLDALGITEYQTAGFLKGDRSKELVKLNTLTVDTANKTYEQLYNLSTAINEFAIEQGACKSKDAMGGLAGGSKVLQYSCVDFKEKTKAELRRWMYIEHDACRPNAIDVPLQTVFHSCLLFSSHNPGSMYIVAGEATYDMDLECTYPEINLKPIDEVARGLNGSTTSMPMAHGDDGADLPLTESYFKRWNNHKIECKTPLEREDLTDVSDSGFIRLVGQRVEQDWTGERHVLNFTKRCADHWNGTYHELNKWHGDIVQTGAMQIVQWCEDMGHTRY